MRAPTFHLLPLACVVRREGTVFTGVCMSTPGEGGFAPSPSHSTSTGSMSFLVGTPVTGPRFLPGGRVPQSQMGVPQDRVPPARDGVPPGQDGVLVYSHWLGPELGQGPGPEQVLYSTFHTAQGLGPESGPENHILCICIGKSK